MTEYGEHTRMNEIPVAGIGIAIIGMAGCFPGAGNIEQFWENIKNSVESISFFSDEELIECGIDAGLIENPDYVKARGIVENIEYFDAAFFNYTPGDAEIMDPQLRIFHECAWEALEYAGYNPEEYEGLIAVYAGSAFNIEWMRRILNAGDDFLYQQGALSFNFREYLSPRISYKFNLRGPSIVVSTACSTSLVAVHLACQGLLNGECDIALAGAVAVGLPKKSGYLYREGMILSHDGHCRAFDANATGTVFSSGVGIVVLKNLEDAIAERDTIHAVIKGTAINNDGTQKIGFTAPSVIGQTDVIKAAHYMAEVEPSSLSYVEAHGTGTKVGDSIEIESLIRAFNTTEKGFCTIGSVKTNVGHLETASGIASLIKTVLCLKYKAIPATLNFQTPNPEINFAESPFSVNTELKAWETDRLPRRAGVNSFGIGGSNAFVILEEWPVMDIPHDSGQKMTDIKNNEWTKSYLIPLSACTPSALKKMAANLAKFLEQTTGINLADVAYTLQLGRKVFEYRTIVICSGVEDAIKQLSDATSLSILRIDVKSALKHSANAGKMGGEMDLPGDEDWDDHPWERICRLWLKGETINWAKIHQGEKRFRVPLPTYPFEGQYYWQLMSGAPVARGVPWRPSIASIRVRPVLENPYEAPANDTEKALVEIWQNIFGFEPIGVRDNFLQLGGDSLKGILMLSRIRKELNLEIKIPDFFHNATIRGLAESTKKVLNLNETYSYPDTVEKKEYYRLSHVQKQLFILHLTYPDIVSYNENMVISIKGKLDNKHVEQAIRQLIQRHESLRTSFEMIDGEPVQKIHEHVAFEMEYYDLKLGDLEKDLASDVTANKIMNFIRPFKLTVPPLLRAGLLELEKYSYLMLLDTHHIASDGTSATILTRDFMSLYQVETLPALKLQYKDYAEWQYHSRQIEAVKKQRQYWLAVFSGALPVLNLPTDYARPPMQSFEGKTIPFGMDNKTLTALKGLAEKKGVTLYILLQGAFYLLMSKVSGQEDIIIGTVQAGRNHADLQQIVGMFIHILPMRNYPENRKTFDQFLRELKENTFNAFENQDCPFENIVENIGVIKDTSRNPIFDVLFQFNNQEIPQLTVQGLQLKPYPYTRGISKFDLSFLGWERPDELFFESEYCTKLFKRETVEILIRYFKEIVAAIIENPGRELWDICRTSEQSKQEILLRLNRDLQSEKMRMEGVEMVLQRRVSKKLEILKDKVAIRCGTRSFTYCEVNRRSHCIAWRIINRGTKEGTFIGILTNNRIALICAIIGVLKARCMFVPLDPNHNLMVLEQMINLADIPLVFVDQAHLDLLTSTHTFEQKKVELWLIDKHIEDGAQPGSIQLPALEYRPEDNIYIYFTSGSTGPSRAIVGKNSSLLHFIDWEIDTFGISDTTHVSQLITPGFDAFLRDMFVPLCSGGVLCIPEDHRIILEAARLVQWIERSGVHLVHCVPTLFRFLKSAELTIASFLELQYILLSGEKIEPADILAWHEILGERIKIINLYGPTETTLIKTFHFIEGTDLNRARIPVGKPMRGTGIMILDEHMNLCDTLVPGEIYIRTDYGTHGYYNNPSLNKKRFLQNPYSDEPGDVIYKTGDMGRISADGTIDLMGRNDRQVKLRGIRVELDGIESILMKHWQVNEAVVIKDVQANGNELLCAYITVKDEHEWKDVPGESLANTLKNYLSTQLPDYMVPAIIEKIGSIPRKPNGKVDYRGLPIPLKLEKKVHVHPRSNIEKKILELWAEILGIEKKNIGVTDHFFKLGGNSLNIMLLIAKMHREFDVRVPLGEVIAEPTIEKLAKYIMKSAEDQFFTIQPVEKKEYYDVSSAQMRLFFLNMMTGDTTNYNIPSGILIKGELNKQHLKKTFEHLIKRHEVLRTSFIMIENKPFQVINDYKQIEFKIEYSECSDEEAKIRIKNFIKSFDLSHAPLFRVQLLSTSECRHILMIDIHHIIADGTSLAILENEFNTIYNGGILPPLKIQYKDFTYWQNQLFKDERIKKQEDYWMSIFKEGFKEGNIPVLNLPTDYPRPSIRSQEGRTAFFTSSKELTEKVKNLERETGTTLYMVLLAAYNILLSKYSLMEEIIIGTPVSGRNHADLQNVIGSFANMLAMKNYPQKSLTFSAFLEEVKENSIKAFDNQDYQFENLVAKIAKQIDPGRNPLFEVVLNVGNMEQGNIGGKENKTEKWVNEPYEFEYNASKYDLLLKVLENINSLRFSLEYSTSLFNSHTIEKITKHYLEILSQVVENKNIKLEDISLSLEVTKVSNVETRKDIGFNF